MNNLTTGKVSTTLLKFAIPFLMASLLQALYGAADLFVVGQYADSAAVRQLLSVANSCKPLRELSSAFPWEEPYSLPNVLEKTTLKRQPLQLVL